MGLSFGFETLRCVLFLCELFVGRDFLSLAGLPVSLLRPSFAFGLFRLVEGHAGRSAVHYVSVFITGLI